MMVALAHDEDGDGIPDSMDPCPHIAGDATDTDGDGVGDACDVNPNTPSEHWILFSTMQAGDTAFDNITDFTQEADSIRATASTQPQITMLLNRFRIDVGWDIHSTIGTGQHQIAFGGDAMQGGTYYFVELDDDSNGSFRDAGLVAFNSATGYVQLDQMDCGLLHAGLGSTRLDIGASHSFVTGWPGQTYSDTVATPAYAGSRVIHFAFNGLDVSIRYLAIISSG
ncbi:MAG: thrombospondin type 3 repeat-containing protein [Deltaproteobacteria bacterium]|nr:thrombospondin type 3 repeat-containing protein [Deltaproteobacteria bacterium]